MSSKAHRRIPDKASFATAKAFSQPPDTLFRLKLVEEREHKTSHSTCKGKRKRKELWRDRQKGGLANTTEVNEARSSEVDEDEL